MRCDEGRVDGDEDVFMYKSYGNEHLRRLLLKRAINKVSSIPSLHW